MAVNGVDQEVMDVRSTRDKSQPIDKLISERRHGTFPSSHQFQINSAISDFVDV